MVIGFTGHRKISGLLWIENLEKILEELKPDMCINGLAVGFDHTAAFTCIKMNILYTAAIPCADQDKKWRVVDKLNYQILLNKAAKIVQVSDGEYTREKMLDRDRWIVDNSDMIISYYDGRLFGGTYFTVMYAEEKGKRILNIKG